MLKKLHNLLFPAQNPAIIRQKYHIPDAIKLEIKITDGKWLVATSPDLPGLITQASNAKELLDMVNDAILTYFDVPKSEADIVFNQLNIEGQGCISYKRQLQTQAA